MKGAYYSKKRFILLCCSWKLWNKNNIKILSRYSICRFLGWKKQQINYLFSQLHFPDGPKVELGTLKDDHTIRITTVVQQGHANEEKQNPGKK